MYDSRGFFVYDMNFIIFVIIVMIQRPRSITCWWLTIPILLLSKDSSKTQMMQNAAADRFDLYTPYIFNSIELIVYKRNGRKGITFMIVIETIALVMIYRKLLVLDRFLKENAYVVKLHRVIFSRNIR